MKNADYARAVRDGGIPQSWSYVVLSRGQEFVALASRELKS
jgi:hypothetical protein